MDTPQNLIDAVNRLKPQTVLLLDTNVIMNSPRLDRRDKWEINAPGPHLLVIPRIVDIELMSLTRGGKDEETRGKASRAYHVTAKLYERGNPNAGIDLGSYRWLITVDVPSDPDSQTLEDDLARINLGKVDTALVKLASACVQDCPDISVVLVTEDGRCRRFARTGGISACRRSDLRSSEMLDEMFRDDKTSGELDIETDLATTVDSDEERPVKIAVTLEELRSEGVGLVARGSGSLTYDGKRFPFRWTFPYQNLSIYNQLTDNYPESAWYAVMPLENVDFMGAEDKIPEQARRFVCTMLEEAYELNDLQSPLTKVRSSIVWHTQMGSTRGGYLNGPLTEVQKEGLTAEQAETIENLRIQHDRYAQSLFDGSAESVGRVYRAAFNLSEADDEIRGYGPHEYNEHYWDLETSLIEFLDEALGVWSVGETREAEYTHRPYEWPEDEEEVTVDDEEEVGEETE